MWFYIFNHQTFGPVDVNTLAGLMRTQQINISTLVWTQGMPDWKKLGETDLAGQLAEIMYPKTPGELPPPLPVQRSGTQTVQPKVDIDMINTLYWSWLVTYFLGMIMQVSKTYIDDKTAEVAFLFIGFLLTIVSTVLLYVLIYQFWKIIQDGFARTSPGKAVGYLFIPYYNLYWIFQTFYGLSKDMNKYQKRHFERDPFVKLHRSKSFISLTYIILLFVDNIFTFILFFVSPASPLASSLNIPTNSNSVFSVLVLIVTLVFLGFMVAMMTDFSLGAKSILKAEEGVE